MTSKRDVYKLGYASMINDISSEGVYSLLPLYLENPALIGFIGGIFNGFAFIIKPFSGVISDITGKVRGFIIGGYFISSLMRLLISLVDKTLIPVLIAIDRIGKGIRDTPRDILLAEYEKKGWAFGIHRAMDTFGAVVGVILAYVLISFLDIKSSILVLALIGFLSLIPLFTLSMKKHKPVKSIQLNVELSLLVFLVGLSLITPMLYIKRASDLIGVGSVLLYAVFNIIYAFSALLIATRSDKLGERDLFMVGILMVALSHILVTFEFFFTAFLAFALYGMAYGVLLPVIFARSGERSGESKGTNIGSVQFSLGISILLSSYIAGLLVEGGNYIFLSLFSLPALFSYLFSDHF